MADKSFSHELSRENESGSRYTIVHGRQSPMHLQDGIQSPNDFDSKLQD